MAESRFSARQMTLDPKLKTCVSWPGADAEMGAIVAILRCLFSARCWAHRLGRALWTTRPQPSKGRSESLYCVACDYDSQWRISPKQGTWHRRKGFPGQGGPTSISASWQGHAIPYPKLTPLAHITLELTLLKILPTALEAFLDLFLCGSHTAWLPLEWNRIGIVLRAY